MSRRLKTCLDLFLISCDNIFEEERGKCVSKTHIFSFSGKGRKNLEPTRRDWV